jgi:hypothetical protein
VLWYPLSHHGVRARPGRRPPELAPDLEELHDIASSEGSWQLVAVDGGRATVVRYRRTSAPAARFPFLERRLRERSLVQMLAALRDAVLQRYPGN